MPKKLIKIEEINFTLDEDENLLQNKTAKILWVKVENIISFEKVKRSYDSRNKNNILIVWSVLVDVWDNEKIIWKIPEKVVKKHKIRLQEPFIYEIKNINKSPKNRPIIVWSWPSGLFCALILAEAWFNPIIIERWSEVSKRVLDVEKFWKDWVLNINSNVQFGEWWAWTFSDGKLYTLVNDPRSKFIFNEFVSAWAPEEIIYSARPHIWTDRLRWVVRNLRKKIITLGWEFYFDTMMTDIKIENWKIIWVYTKNSRDAINRVSDNNLVSDAINPVSTEKKYLETDNLILAIWHSARETYEMLYKSWLNIAQKPFAIWVRIEHPRTLINASQFWESCLNPKLPTANYKLVSHNEETRSVYTFCMCPGWEVVNASSEEWRLCVNGMSHYAQNNINSNSALLVNVNPSDFPSTHPLAWIDFQRYWEEKAFVAWWSDFSAPAQLVWDFLAWKHSKNIGKIATTFKKKLHFTSIETCLPDFVIKALKKALVEFDKKIKGFANPDAILIAVEARTSSVVRFERNPETLESNISWIYPIWEWAWYAGWITSSAIDGLVIWEKIIEKYL